MIQNILKTNAFFQRIYAEAKDPILIIDPVTADLVQANQAALETLGIESLEQLQKTTLMDVSPAHQADGAPSAELIRHMPDVLANSNNYARFEFLHQTLDGKPIDFEITATLIEIDGKRFIHGHMRDISEKKLLLQQLAESERSFRRIFDESISPALIISLQGHIIEANQTTVELFGYPDKAALTGKTPLEMAPPIQPDGRDSLAMGLEQLALTIKNHTHHFEWRMQRADGSTLATEITLTLIHSYRENNATVVHSHIRDLTEQNQLKRALIAEKERAEITLASIGDAVITTDHLGRITFLNQVASDLTGWSQKDAINRPLADVFNIINETTRQKVINPVDEVLAHGKKVNLANHTILISRDGQEYPIEDSAAPIYLPDGGLLGCVLVFHDVSEKHALMKTMSWQVGHDVLTGLPNRALLADRFSRAIANAQRQKSLLVVCMLDLDEFKPINDQHGHAVGDQVLIEVANRLKLAVRGEDTIARLGGDEFVLLLSEFTEPIQVEATLTRILASLAMPYVINDLALAASVSIGIAVYPLDDANADTLMRHADQAMYTAKQAGRNRVHWFDAAHDQAAQTTHRTLERIRSALENHELCLYYQPKVNMRSGSIVGMEALLRWQHPERGLVPPLEFLPLAEQHDLIIQIGEWVISETLQQIARWRAAGHHWRVSVNIAAKHFQQANFFERLQSLLRQAPDVDPHFLEIEILESIALGDLQHVQQLIHACQALGIGFSLDDFGTGYSSLSYLKRLPADTIKIDQSFVRDMLEDTEDLSMIEAVINLATAFKRNVVAEGVESAEHGVMLMRLGCDVAQGYGIARPMPAQNIMPWADQFTPDPKWAIWGKADSWDMRDFPLLVAEIDHLQWVKQLVTAVTEQETLRLSSDELTNHHLCRFGIWYYGYGKTQYGNTREFIDIEPVHKEIHRVGAQIMQLHHTGDRVAAKALCQTLAKLKDQIIKKLNALHWLAAGDLEVEFTLTHDAAEDI